jgi:tetratricopeptide (TPR) repeat protein
MASFISRWRSAAQPVPHPRSSRPKALAQKRKQRLLLISTAAILLAMTAGGFAYSYIANAPARARAEMQLGVQKMGPGTYDQAIKSFDHAIDTWPDFAEAYLNRGLAEHAVGRRPAALVDLEKALDLDPSLVLAHNERGQIYLENGDAHKAILEFEKSLQVKATVDGYYQRGQAHELLGEHQQAVDDYDAAIHESPDAPYVYRARAAAKRNLGDMEGATADQALADQRERLTQ